MKFVCENCGNEKIQNITCHGHKISYQNSQFVCIDCQDRPLSDQEIAECIPKCCSISMQPMKK
jgi:uncharacterized protein YPO0396